MTSSHCEHYTGDNYRPPSQDDSLEDHRHPIVVIQQGPGTGSYGTIPGTTVCVQYGFPRRRIHGKSIVVFAVFLLVVSAVLLFCGTLVAAGVIRCEPFFQPMLVMTLFGFGGVILLAGLFFFISSVRHEMEKRNNQQQQVTERDLLIGSGQPRFGPASQPYYQPSHRLSGQRSHQPSYQQSSGITPQPFQPIPPSTNPPPYDSTTSGPYPNAGS